MKWLLNLFSSNERGIPNLKNPPPPPKPLVTDEERALINESDYTVLAYWWGILNNWDWPVELLPEEKKENHPHGRRSALMNLIDRKISHRYVLRFHNKEMTESEFEDFWQAFHQGNEHAKRRYFERVNRKYEEDRKNG